MIDENILEVFENNDQLHFPILKARDAREFINYMSEESVQTFCQDIGVNRIVYTAWKMGSKTPDVNKKIIRRINKSIYDVLHIDDDYDDDTSDDNDEQYDKERQYFIRAPPRRTTQAKLRPPISGVTKHSSATTNHSANSKQNGMDLSASQSFQSNGSSNDVSSSYIEMAQDSADNDLLGNHKLDSTQSSADINSLYHEIYENQSEENLDCCDTVAESELVAVDDLIDLMQTKHTEVGGDEKRKCFTDKDNDIVNIELMEGKNDSGRVNYFLTEICNSADQSEILDTNSSFDSNLRNNENLMTASVTIDNEFERCLQEIENSMLDLAGGIVKHNISASDLSLRTLLQTDTNNIQLHDTYALDPDIPNISHNGYQNNRDCPDSLTTKHQESLSQAYSVNQQNENKYEISIEQESEIDELEKQIKTLQVLNGVNAISDKLTIDHEIVSPVTCQSSINSDLNSAGYDEQDIKKVDNKNEDSAASNCSLVIISPCSAGNDQEIMASTMRKVMISEEDKQTVAHDDNNDDDDSDGGYLYVLTDTPDAPLLHRIQFGICQDPVTLLTQAKHFNVDIRLVTAILLHNSRSTIQNIRDILHELDASSVAEPDVWFTCSLTIMHQAIAQVISNENKK